MAYCRWSCLSGRSDAYVYESGSGSGFVTHLRGTDHPEAGKMFTHETAGECASELERLVSEGFVIPLYVIQSLREEEEEDG